VFTADEIIFLDFDYIFML